MEWFFDSTTIQKVGYIFGCKVLDNQTSLIWEKKSTEFQIL